MNTIDKPQPPHGEQEVQFIRYALNQSLGKVTLIFRLRDNTFAEVQRTFTLIAEQKLHEFLVEMTGKQVPPFSEVILQDLKGSWCQVLLGPAKRPGYVNLVRMLGPISTLEPTSPDRKINSSKASRTTGGIR